MYRSIGTKLASAMHKPMKDLLTMKKIKKK